MPKLSRDLGNTAAYANFIDAILYGANTVDMLIEKTGLGDATVRKLVMALRRRKRMRISDWFPDAMGRLVMPVYSLGNLPDAIRRPRQTTKEKSQAWRDSQKAKRLAGLPYWKRDYKKSKHKELSCQHGEKAHPHP